MTGLRAALDVLCFETPESPASAGQVIGHQEAWCLDEQDRGTACPGTVLPFVKAYRSCRKRAGPFAARPPV